MISTEEYESLLEESIYNFFDESNTKDIVLCDFFSEEAIAEDVELCRDILLNEVAEISDAEKKEFDRVLKDNNKNHKNVDKASKAVKKAFGIDILAVGHDIAKYSANVIKKDGVNKKSKDKINKYWNDQVEALAGKISVEADNDILTKFADNKDFQKYLKDNKSVSKTKIKQALILLCRVLLASIIISLIMQILLGPVGTILDAVLCAPIIEESAKVISVKGGYTVEFALVFNIFEFSSYVIANPTPSFAKVRLVVVGMHLTTTLIHYLADHPELLKKVKLDKIVKVDEGKPKNVVLGFFLGWLIHTTWNASAVCIGLKELMKGI